MSYCRWSSDDFQSDVYVYENVSGFWSIDVAGNRVVWKVPLPPEPSDPEGIAWIRRHYDIIRMMRYDENYERVPLDHPAAGRSFAAASPGEAAEVLERLRNEGLHVPDGVIETLRREEDGRTQEEAVEAS